MAKNQRKKTKYRIFHKHNKRKKYRNNCIIFYRKKRLRKRIKMNKQKMIKYIMKMKWKYEIIIIQNILWIKTL